MANPHPVASTAESRSALDAAITDYGLDSVLRQFVESGVVWAFPRFPDQMISSFREGPDLDLWASRESFTVALRILESAGFRVIGGSARPGDSFLVRLRPPQGGSAPLLEIHVGDYWGPFRCLLSEQDLRVELASSRRSFLSELNLFILATVRPAGRGRLQEERLSFARKVWRENKDPCFRQVWRDYAQNLLGSSGILLEGILKNEMRSGKPEGLIFPLANLWYSSHRFRYLRSAVRRRLRRVWTDCFGVRLTVAALGVDGAGKSSLLEGLQDRLEVNDYEAHYIYGGRTKGNSPLVSAIRRLVLWLLPKYGNQENSQIEPEKSESMGGKTLGAVLKWGSVITYTFDYWTRLWLHVLRPTRRPRIALVDRGPDDFVTISLPRRVIRFFQYLAPARDLVLWCDAPAQAIWERKRERSPEDIEKRQGLYRSHISKPLRGQMARRVDTGTSKEHSVSDAYRAVSLALLVKSGWLDRPLFQELDVRSGVSLGD